MKRLLKGYMKAMLWIALGINSLSLYYWRRKADPAFREATQSQVDRMRKVFDSLPDTTKEMLGIIGYSAVGDFNGMLGIEDLTVNMPENLADYIRTTDDPYLFAGAFGFDAAVERFGPTDTWPPRSYFEGHDAHDPV